MKHRYCFLHLLECGLVFGKHKVTNELVQGADDLRVSKLCLRLKVKVLVRTFDVLGDQVFNKVPEGKNRLSDVALCPQ